MKWVDSITSLIDAHDALVLIISSAIILILAFSNLVLYRKLGKLCKYCKPATLMPVAEEPSPESDGQLLRRVERAEEQVSLIGEWQKELESPLVRSVQRIGLIKFDAFPDVGGEQSFALALLDREMSGVVLSNLFSRADSRVYAKPVSNGRSDHALSGEEVEAIRRASGAER